MPHKEDVNSLIHVTESNNLVMPNDRVLLNELQPQVKYRNVKTGEESFKNSGYGLYLVKELCLKYNGHFKIASGGYQLTYFKDQIYRRKIHFQGTAICVDIGIRKMSNFEDVIKELNSKAESLAKGKNKTIKKASASSLGYYNDKK